MKGMRSFAFCALLLGGCTQMAAREAETHATVDVGPAPTRNLTRNCVADYTPGTDYFPQKSVFTDSAQLKVSYHGHWKRLTFTPAVDTRETMNFVLVQCGTPAPKTGPRDIVVEVPIRDFATANASMLGAAVMLGAEDRLQGVPSTANVSLPSIRKRIDAGEIISIYAAAHSNAEQAAGLGVDIFFTFYSAYPDANIHGLLLQMGANAAPQADHTERTPLGRAEWIKYLGLFLNEEDRANAIFDDRKRRYLSLSALTGDVRHRPLVQLGYPETRDRWSQAGGDNNFARLIADAGGRHAWSDVRTSGSLTYAPIEQVYDRASEAEVWIGSYAAGPPDMATLRRDMPRLAWIRPIRTARVYWLDANKTEGRRNPWGDQGMTEPQDALAEMIGVLHPEILTYPAAPRFIRHVPESPST